MANAAGDPLKGNVAIRDQAVVLMGADMPTGKPASFLQNVNPVGNRGFWRSTLQKDHLERRRKTVFFNPTAGREEELRKYLPPVNVAVGVSFLRAGP